MRSTTACYLNSRTTYRTVVYARCLQKAAGFAAIALLFGLLAGSSPVLAQSTDNPLAAGSQSADPTRRVVVRFVTESDFPPFNFYDEDGVLVGFNVDVARAICLELSTACDIKVRPWGELFLTLKRGEADAVIASHTVTPQALMQVDFTDRYFFTPGRFVGRRDAKDLVISPDGLEDKRIGVARGTAHEAYLREYFLNSSIQVFENPELARDALKQGKVDLIFDDGISLAFWLHGTASRNCCDTKGGPYLEPKYFGDGIAIAVPKNDPQIKDLINQALKRLHETGRFQELVERYFPIAIY